MTAVFFFLLGAAGLLSNWALKYLRGKTANNLWCYLFKCETRATAITLITFVGSWFGFMATEPALSWRTAAGAFFVGYLIDAKLNKG